MNWLDYSFIGILAISVIISIFRGLTKEVLSLLIWVVAFWLAYHYVDVGANYLESYIELPSARHLISFVVILITALLLGGLVNFILAKLIQSTGLSAMDRFLGMFFGALRALVIIVVIAFFIKATPLSEDPWWKQSRLAPHATRISEWIREKMPEDFASYFSFIENNQPLDNASKMVEDALKNPELKDEIGDLIEQINEKSPHENTNSDTQEGN